MKKLSQQIIIILGLCFPGFLQLSIAAEKITPNKVSRVTEDFIKQEVVRSQQSARLRKIKAESLVVSASRALTAGKYEQAKRFLTQALQVDPENKSATLKLQQVKRLLPSDPQKTTSIIAEHERRSRVEQGLRLAEARNLLSSAVLKSQKAEKMIASVRASDLQGALENLRAAREDLERSKLKLSSLPSIVEISSEETQALALGKKISRLLVLAGKKLDTYSREQALVQARKEKEKVSSYKKEQLAILMKRAKAHVYLQQYDQAVAILRQYLKEDPVNTEAQSLLAKARDDRYQKRRNLVRDEARHERINTLQDLEEAAIPSASRIHYPDDWEELRKRQDLKQRVAQGGNVPAWKLKIINKLEKTVTFAFEDVPLKDVIDSLANENNLNIILQGIEDEQKEEPISLQIKKMKLENALKWLMTITNLSYDIKNEAIVIGTGEALAGSWITRVIDISDLVNPIEDAPPPSTAGEEDTDENVDAVDNEQLLALIRKINPKSWSEEGESSLGSVSFTSGSLVIRQTAEVLANVMQMLGDLRAASAIQVAVTGRFVTVQDDFLQQINSSFPGISNTYHDEPSKFFPIGGNASNIKGSSIAHTPPALANSGVNNSPEDPSLYNGGWGRNYGWGDVSHLNNTPASLVSVLGDPLTAVPNAGLWLQIAQAGYLGNIETMWMLQMFKESRKTDQLFAPHLIAYNNKLAWITVETEVPYISGYESASSGDEGGALVPTVETETDGVLLMVRPTVSTDKKYITLDVRARTTSLPDPQMTGAGSSVTLQGAWGESYRIDLPTVVIRETRTYATMPDGGSILISGFGVNINMRGKNGVPVLSDIPILGNFFSNRVKQEEKRNIMLLLNSRMILLDEEEAKLER